MKEMVIGLLVWISNTSALQYNPEFIPDVAVVSKGDLIALAFPHRTVADLPIGNCKVLGLYNYEDESVYLSNTIDLARIEGRAILLHELVHYLQYQTDLKHQPIDTLEPLAYQLEARYVQQQRIRQALAPMESPGATTDQIAAQNATPGNFSLTGTC